MAFWYTLRTAIIRCDSSCAVWAWHKILKKNSKRSKDVKLSINWNKIQKRVIQTGNDFKKVMYSIHTGPAAMSSPVTSRHGLENKWRKYIVKMETVFNIHVSAGQPRF